MSTPSDGFWVPVQMLFTSATEEGVVVDCTVAAEVTTRSRRRIPSGSPFSLVIEVSADARGDAEPAEGADRLAGRTAVALLRQWCDDGAVVQASTAPASDRLVLEHRGDTVVLEIL